MAGLKTQYHMNLTTGFMNQYNHHQLEEYLDNRHGYTEPLESHSSHGFETEHHKSLVNSYSDSRGQSCHCSDLGGQISLCDCPAEVGHDISSGGTDTDSCCDEEPPNYEEAGLLDNIERYCVYLSIYIYLTVHLYINSFFFLPLTIYLASYLSI